MDTKLIIVDGHSSVGKSSISKSVYQQISRVSPAYWLHEECENHPIRDGEFSFGALDTAEGMERNRKGMLKKWMAFGDTIKASGKVCVTEGCFLHAYDRYFIHSSWDENEIAVYTSQVLDAISPLNPVIIFLHRPDLRRSLEKAFAARGKWWRDLILKRDDRHVYFKNHSYIGENSMFEAVAFEQERMGEIFDGLHCLKIKIDTSEEQWEGYVQEIISLCGVAYKKIESCPFEPGKYTGTYRWQEGTSDNKWLIRYDENNNCLYTSLFWPYMPMRCKAEDIFELISFPVELHFQTIKNRMQFRVLGNYDWEYNDQVFIRM